MKFSLGSQAKNDVPGTKATPSVNASANSFSALRRSGISIQRRERLSALSGVPQLAVRIVFKDRNAMARGNLNQLFSTRMRQRGALRIRKFSNDVDQFWARAFECIFELIDAHSFVIAFD